LSIPERVASRNAATHTHTFSNSTPKIFGQAIRAEVSSAEALLLNAFAANPLQRRLTLDGPLGAATFLNNAPERGRQV